MVKRAVLWALAASIALGTAILSAAAIRAFLLQTLLEDDGPSATAVVGLFFLILIGVGSALTVRRVVAAATRK